MHKVVERPIELLRVTFADATPSDGLAMHTRAALRSATYMIPSTVPATTSSYPDPVGHESSSTSTPTILATIDEPASPILPRRFDKLTQPPERYSSELFFMDSGEPTNYEKVTKCEEFPD